MQDIGLQASALQAVGVTISATRHLEKGRWLQPLDCATPTFFPALDGLFLRCIRCRRASCRRECQGKRPPQARPQR